MRHFANVYMCGNVSKVGELRSTKDGEPVLEFDIAVSYGIPGRSSANFITVVCYKNTARVASMINKGESVLVRGWLKMDKWMSKSAKKRFVNKVKVVAEDIGLNDRKDEADRYNAFFEKDPVNYIKDITEDDNTEDVKLSDDSVNVDIPKPKKPVKRKLKRKPKKETKDKENEG